MEKQFTYKIHFFVRPNKEMNLKINLYNDRAVQSRAENEIHLQASLV